MALTNFGCDVFFFGSWTLKLPTSEKSIALGAEPSFLCVKASVNKLLDATQGKYEERAAWFSGR